MSWTMREGHRMRKGLAGSVALGDQTAAGQPVWARRALVPGSGLHCAGPIRGGIAFWTR